MSKKVRIKENRFSGFESFASCSTKKQKKKTVPIC